MGGRGKVTFYQTKPNANQPTPRPPPPPRATAHGSNGPRGNRPNGGGGSIYYYQTPQQMPHPLTSSSANSRIQSTSAQRPRMVPQVVGKPDQKSPPPPGCICFRDVGGVVCDCGFYRRGLKSDKLCPVHPNVHFLNDLEKCPRCKGRSLEEEESSG